MEKKRQKGMTKQEFEKRWAEGELTFREILENEEHATPEMLRVLNTMRPDQTLRRLTMTYIDGLHLLYNIPARVGTAKLLDEWEAVTGRLMTGENTCAELQDIIDKSNALTKKSVELMTARDLPAEEKEQLMTLCTAIIVTLEGISGTVENAISSIRPDDPCNTDCPAYARGTCRYENREECPRFGRTD